MIDRREFFGVAPGMKSPTGDKLETIMHNEPIDFVGFDYSVGDRRAEQTLLPLAKTWAQFFLKYVISHPAVTVARTGTSNAKHMLENIGGGIGRLPNEAMRQRMAELVDSWPQAGDGGGTR